MDRLLLALVILSCIFDAPASGCEGLTIQHDDLIRVPVEISGRPAHLALDPIGQVLVDAEWAAEHDLSTVDSATAGYGVNARIGGAGGEEQEPRFALGQTIRIGDIELTPPPIIVVDLRGPLGGPLSDLDGLLGTELFTDHVLDLHLPDGCLQLHPRADFEAPTGDAIPVQRMRRRPVVEGVITLPDGQTHRLNLLLDFGMTGSLRISTRTVDKLGLADRMDTRRPDRQDSGLGGALESLSATLPALRIGETAWRDLDIRLARETEGADADPPWDALIGVGLLRDRRVTYDAAGNRLWLSSVSRRSFRGRRVVIPPGRSRVR